tara:strand:+ start:197 stop:496 length:300 start_codon:yes stop_codon:yes gene_type:complete
MKKEIILSVAVLMLAACGGSSEDVDAVAAQMMSGSDPLNEKDAKCMAKSMKEVATDDQWDLLVKQGKGELDSADMTMDQAFELMGPTMAAAAKCGVEIF